MVSASDGFEWDFVVAKASKDYVQPALLAEVLFSFKVYLPTRQLAVILGKRQHSTLFSRVLRTENKLYDKGIGELQPSWGRASITRRTCDTFFPKDVRGEGEA